MKLLVTADYPYMLHNGRYYCEVPWDNRFIDLFQGRVEHILLVGRVRTVSELPPASHEVDTAIYEVVPTPDWDGLGGWLRKLPANTFAIARAVHQCDAVFLKLFYMNSLLAFALNRLPGNRKPDACLLVGDAANAVLLRDDVAKSAGMRNTYGRVVAWATAHVLRKTRVAATVAHNLWQTFAPQRPDVVVANESWLEPEMFQYNPRQVGEKAVHLLFVGRLIYLKGIDMLVDVVLGLMKQGVEIDFTVVGDGPLRTQLVKKVQAAGQQERIRFSGWLKPLSGELLDSYRQSDILILPSYAEGLPLVLMEAMANSCAVIASAVNGTPELVVDGKTGLLIPPGDPTAVRQAIVRFVEDPQLWRSCIETGYAAAQEHTFVNQRSRVSDALLKACGEAV